MDLNTEETFLLYQALAGEYRSLLAASNSPNLSKEQSTFLIERIRPITDLMGRLKEDQHRRTGARP